MRFMLVCLCVGMIQFAFAQEEGKQVRKGNKAYEKGDYEAAAQAYREGLEKNTYSYEANFNLGDALYKQGEYESAAKQFDLLRQPGMDKDQLAKVYHNFGNSMLEQQKYQEAVDAYKESLRNNPSDADTRYNLVYAMEKLREQQQQQQNQDQQNQDNQDQQENQDQENQENQENKQDQNQQNEEQQNQEQQDQQQNQSGEDQQEQEQQQQQQGQEGKEGDEQQGQQQQQQPGEQKDQISKKEAERILQAIQLDEQQLHDKNKKKKLKGKKVRILKDW